MTKEEFDARMAKLRERQYPAKPLPMPPPDPKQPPPHFTDTERDEEQEP